MPRPPRSTPCPPALSWAPCDTVQTHPAKTQYEHLSAHPLAVHKPPRPFTASPSGRCDVYERATPYIRRCWCRRDLDTRHAEVRHVRSRGRMMAAGQMGSCVCGGKALASGGDEAWWGYTMRVICGRGERGDSNEMGPCRGRERLEGEAVVRRGRCVCRRACLCAYPSLQASATAWSNL